MLVRREPSANQAARAYSLVRRILEPFSRNLLDSNSRPTYREAADQTGSYPLPEPDVTHVIPACCQIERGNPAHGFFHSSYKCLRHPLKVLILVNLLILEKLRSGEKQVKLNSMVYLNPTMPTRRSFPSPWLLQSVILSNFPLTQTMTSKLVCLSWFTIDSGLVIVYSLDQPSSPSLSTTSPSP